ncbi:MAG TPA: hypothetical protein VFH31_00605 [Pyrinomonadaceae bacterium]|nr:hypothetical protein [Pyrinomonadaceae bacterium]
MYCPSCGIQLAQTLSYCNRCGANLSPLKDLSTTITASTPAHEIAPRTLNASAHEIAPQAHTVNSLIWAIVATTIIVLGMGLGALVLMRDGGIDEGLGRIFVILCFLTLPIIEGVLIWQLLSSNRRVKKLSGQVQEHASSHDELRTATVRSLSEPGEPISSVAEHTTRTFEPSYRGREHS